MARPAIGSNGLPPCLRILDWSSSETRTNRSSPNSPQNMLPLTKADRLPNIGRVETAGSGGTNFRKAALACSLGFGIVIGLMALILAADLVAEPFLIWT